MSATFNLFRPSSYAVASLRIGIIIFLNFIIAVVAYTTPAITHLLFGHGPLFVILAILLSLIYIFFILVGAYVGTVLSIISFVRREGRCVAAVSGLALNGSVLLSFVIIYFWWTNTSSSLF